MGRRGILVLAAASLFVAVQVAQSPHLVHHLFERGEMHDACALSAAADHLPGLDPDVHLTPAADSCPTPLALRVPERPDQTVPLPVAARAPPLRIS